VYYVSAELHKQGEQGLCEQEQQQEQQLSDKQGRLFCLAAFVKIFYVSFNTDLF